MMLLAPVADVNLSHDRALSFLDTQFVTLEAAGTGSSSKINESAQELLHQHEELQRKVRLLPVLPHCLLCVIEHLLIMTGIASRIINGAISFHCLIPPTGSFSSHLCERSCSNAVCFDRRYQRPQRRARLIIIRVTGDKRKDSTRGSGRTA